jgi:hypothetical protein
VAPGVLFVAVLGVEELFANAVGGGGGGVSGEIVGLDGGWGGHLSILYRVFLITFCLDGLMYFSYFSTFARLKKINQATKKFEIYT